MKLLSFRTPDGVDSVGALTSEGVRDLRHLLGGAARGGLSPMRQLLSATGGSAPDTQAVGGGQLFAIDALVVGVPVPDPTKIVAAPVNYRDHQAEMNQDAHIDALGVFLKAPSSLLSSGGTVRLPYVDRRFDQEGELALVVGRTASHVSVEDALSYVFGYTTLLDMTMRGGEDRSTRKSFDTFTPMGPWLVTPDEVGPLEHLRLECSVNGQPRQDADIKDLIWDVPRIISYVSSVMALQPGDIITTGTPAGVGAVHDGDSIVVDISRVSRLEVRVSQHGAVICPTRGAGRGPAPPLEVTPIRTRYESGV